MDQGANNKRWGFVTEENKLELSAVQNLPSVESKCFSNNSLIKYYCRSHEQLLFQIVHKTNNLSKDL